MSLVTQSLREETSAREGRSGGAIMTARLLGNVIRECVRCVQLGDVAPAMAFAQRELEHLTLGELGQDNRWKDLMGRGISTCTTAYRGECCELSLFFLAPGASLYPHDHPDMHVFSKVLHGSVRVISFDWVDASHVAGAEGKAVAHSPLTLSAAGSSAAVLGPRHRNIHEIQCSSNDGAVFFDVIAPPYNDHEERRCTFYSVFPVDQQRHEAGGADSDGSTGRGSPSIIAAGGAAEQPATVLLRPDAALDSQCFATPYTGVTPE